MIHILTFAWAIFTAQAGMADIISATYIEPTDRYGHGILGDAIEWGAIDVRTDEGEHVVLRLPDTHVFEDVAPRLVDVDLDGDFEIIAVQTDMSRGARLAIFDEKGLVTAAPYIGRTHRWLAPIGATDLDGDGKVEIAYVDRPHLAKTIRIWRFDDGELINVGDLPGYTNHRIGERDIAGGIRDCGDGPEMVVVDARWQSIFTVQWTGEFLATARAPHKGRPSINDVLNCQ